jgi:hypothetical protein
MPPLLVRLLIGVVDVVPVTTTGAATERGWDGDGDGNTNNPDCTEELPGPRRRSGYAAEGSADDGGGGN